MAKPIAKPEPDIPMNCSAEMLEAISGGADSPLGKRSFGKEIAGSYLSICTDDYQNMAYKKTNIKQTIKALILKAGDVAKNCLVSDIPFSWSAPLPSM